MGDGFDWGFQIPSDFGNSRPSYFLNHPKYTINYEILIWKGAFTYNGQMIDMPSLLQAENIINCVNKVKK